MVNSTEKGIRELLQIILEKASEGLKKAKEKEKSPKEESAQAKVPAPVEILPQIVKPQEKLDQKNIPALVAIINPSDEILQKALNAEIRKISHFYANASDKALTDLIALSKNSLKNKQTLEFYGAAFKKTTAEIEKLILKIIKKAQTRIKINAAKDLRFQARGQDPLEVQLKQHAKHEKKTISSTNPPEEAIENCSLLYIMLDVPELNIAGKPIDWKGVIHSITTQMRNAKFISVDYRHITLGWCKFKQPITQKIRKKLEGALNRANENLKIPYPNGIQNIALLDSAHVLGENAVAFLVAKNTDLIKIIKTISEFLSLENLNDFEFSGLKEESPLHVTLGRIIPEKKAYDFKDQIRILDAPSGAKASQGESFASDTFRISCTLPNTYQHLATYKF